MPHTILNNVELTDGRFSTDQLTYIIRQKGYNKIKANKLLVILDTTLPLANKLLIFLQIRAYLLLVHVHLNGSSSLSFLSFDPTLNIKHYCI